MIQTVNKIIYNPSTCIYKCIQLIFWQSICCNNIYFNFFIHNLKNKTKYLWLSIIFSQFQLFLCAVILYKYWLHERVSWDIVNPRKPISTKARRGLTLVFEGWQFPMLPSCAFNNYYIIMNVNIKYIIYITYGFKTIQVKWKEFVFRTPYIQTLIQHQSESMVNSACINSA